MTELFKGWLLGIVAVSWLGAAAQSVTEGTPGERMARLCTALALLLAVLLPLRGAKNLPESAWTAWKTEYQRENADTSARTEALLRQTTEEALCAWVRERAASMGIRCQARVETVLRDGAACPSACTITLLSPSDGAEIAALRREIAAALGIETVTVADDGTVTE